MTSEDQDANIREYADEDVRAGITFYIVFMVVMIGMYAMALVTNPALRNPSRLIPFTLMLLIHAAVHWVILFRSGQRRWIAPYFVVQGVLLFTINYIGQNQGLLLGLYFAQIGAVVGVLGSLRKSLVPIAAYFALATANYALIWSWENIAWWAALAIPMGLFVVIYVTMFNRQASARQQAQQLLKELEAANLQLVEYAERVEELTLATERQRMARELHDTLAQGLAGLILQLEAVDAHLGRDQVKNAQGIVHQAMDRARSTLADARRAIQDLRSDKAASEDLGEAVRAEIERFTDATGIPCSLDMMLPKDIPTEIGEHVHRAVAEGLTNIARHAQATLVEMRIGQEEDGLEILIRDDGVGFDLVAVSESGGHYGLVGLRERARLAGGNLQVISAPGAGTTLSIRLPLESAGAE